MKILSATAVSLVTLNSLVLGSVLPNVKYVKIPFAKKQDGRGSELGKRARGDENFVLANKQSFYSVELALGTPSQNVTVLLDTGSADLWVSSNVNPYCGSTMNCDQYGVFDQANSSTFKANNSAPFYASYGDGTFAEGVFGQDKLHYSGGLDLSGLSFAVANKSNSTVGVLGIGLPMLEVTYSGKVTVTDKKRYEYDNFPQFLKRSGAIDAIAYSLFLNDESQTSGSVLFGAVDHSKYLGQLYTIPLIDLYKAQGYQRPVAFDVTLQGLGLQTRAHNTTLTTTRVPALLDSGTTLTYLPAEAVSLMAKSLNATFSKKLGYYEYECPATSDNATSVVFDLGGFHINAPLSDFTMQTNVGTCVLAIVPQTGNATAILGDSFLRSAYVVYDLDNYEVSLAQANYASGKEDIEVIRSTVPGAVKAPGYNSTWVKYASATAGGNIFTTTVHSYNTTTAAQSSKSTTVPSSSTKPAHKSITNKKGGHAGGHASGHGSSSGSSHGSSSGSGTRSGSGTNGVAGGVVGGTVGSSTGHRSPSKSGTSSAALIRPTLRLPLLVSLFLLTVFYS
ncbi:Aspartyl protease [Saccharomyces pastorianus]|uniref:Aspartyl protease n=1 Tax=Saccharomyces pastorianus TaxID=27292 RepID=A0A6C1EBG7_SACPS|nr:Aspartyl protease [Saccharomyces pastorianus]